MNIYGQMNLNDLEFRLSNELDGRIKMQSPFKRYDQTS